MCVYKYVCIFNCYQKVNKVVVVVVEIFIHGAVKATVTNAPQSQLNK